MAAIAEAQKGLVTRGQLFGLGIPAGTIDEWVRAGRLNVIYAGVYAVGHAVLAPQADVLAAVLACGAGTVLSHRSAAELWDLVEARPGMAVQVTATGHGIDGPRGIYVHRTKGLTAWDRAVVSGIPVTSAARTVFDFASQASQAEMEAAYERGLIEGNFSRDDMVKMAMRLKGRRGITKVRRLIDRNAPPSVTIGEAHRMLLELVRSSALPHPRTEYPIGRRRADICWPDAMLIVEMDGSKWHDSPGRNARDKRRDADLAALGWLTIRVTWTDLTKDRIGTISRIAATHAHRSRPPVSP